MPLANDISSVFTTMKDMDAGGDAYMALNMATYIATYLATCTVMTKTVPPVSVPMAPAAGFFALGQSLILAGCQAQSNSALATAIASGVDAIAVAGANAVNGTFAGVSSTIETALNQVFNAMDSMDAGGDDAFANALGIAVIAYVGAGGAVPGP